MTDLLSAGALQTAARIREGHVSAREVVSSALSACERRNGAINAFTAITRERALAEADAIDARRQRGERLGPLAGVPYAAKNLYDVAGVVTLAGSRINADNAPAAADSTAVARMRDAGAVLVGLTNMDEYAYGFTTENTHYGACHNPHDLARSAGGSSGGSAAAVAAGCVPLALGSDTNGSIRVPASFCGLFGLKPTYGRLSRRGAFPFSTSLDHVGPFARSVADLAACYDALQGPDPLDPACAQRAIEPTLGRLAEGTANLRVGVLGGYFETHAHPEAIAVRDTVVRALGASVPVTLPEVERARAAAYVITAAEGGALHLANLKRRAADFDPMSRERLLAGALTPAVWLHQAQRLRAWFRARALEVFDRVDILVAAAAPFGAVPLGSDTTVTIDGRELPLRPNIGLLTQPISFIGLPVAVVPVWGGALPIGVQLISAPWREADALRVAARLERDGVASAPIASGLG